MNVRSDPIVGLYEIFYRRSVQDGWVIHRVCLGFEDRLTVDRVPRGLPRDCLYLERDNRLDSDTEALEGISSDGCGLRI
jgi:hypothetical protein